MASVRRVRYRISSDIIPLWIDADELFEAGHEVHDWTVEIAEDYHKEIMRTVPPMSTQSRHGHRGSGRMKASIRVSASRVAPEQIEIVGEAQVRYAAWVHGGTAHQSGAFIYSTMGQANKTTVDAIMAAGQAHLRPPPNMQGLYMSVPPGPGGTQKWLMRVRGQRANPFLIRAYNRLCLDHKALTPLAPPVTGR